MENLARSYSFSSRSGIKRARDSIGGEIGPKSVGRLILEVLRFHFLLDQDLDPESYPGEQGPNSIEKKLD